LIFFLSGNQNADIIKFAKSPPKRMFLYSMLNLNLIQRKISSKLSIATGNKNMRKEN